MNKQGTKNVFETAILNTKGKFFSVVFRKKNGELRKMNCRIGVKKHLKSNASATTAGYANYITVYDVVAKAYRTINLDTIREFRGSNTVLKTQ